MFVEQHATFTASLQHGCCRQSGIQSANHTWHHVSCMARKAVSQPFLAWVATSLTGADQAGTQTTITTDLKLKLVPILGDINIRVAVELTTTPIQSSEVLLKFEIQIHNNRRRNQVSRPSHIVVSMPR